MTTIQIMTPPQLTKGPCGDITARREEIDTKELKALSSPEFSSLPTTAILCSSIIAILCYPSFEQSKMNREQYKESTNSECFMSCFLCKSLAMDGGGSFYSEAFFPFSTLAFLISEPLISLTFHMLSPFSQKVILDYLFMALLAYLASFF